MDINEIEQNRGITIFADQGVFQYNNDTYYIIDTLGHMDFSAETERTISALDYAILIISGSSGKRCGKYFNIGILCKGNLFYCTMARSGELYAHN